MNNTNSLASICPLLAKEWHPSKNPRITPKDVVFGSHKNVFWLCQCGFEWSARISSRSRGGNGCPRCAGKIIDETNNLAITNPEILKSWNFKLNKTSPYKIGRGSKVKVWWICENCNSDYTCSVGNRVHGKACSYCHGKKVNQTNSLLSLYPGIAKEWDYKKNTLSPCEVTSRSHEGAWWRCGKHGHSYYATVNNRTRYACGVGCPFCSNQKILSGFNDMWTTDPALAELLRDRNHGYIFSSKSNSKIEWNCSLCGKSAGVKTINKVFYRGVKCEECSNSMSMGERLMYHFLAFHEISFEREKIFDWSDRKRYDFYLPCFNCIIEVHGSQHYTKKGFERLGGRTLAEEQENDLVKKKNAVLNGIESYIVIDARESDYSFISSSIVHSDIFTVLMQQDVTDWEYIINEARNRSCQS